MKALTITQLNQYIKKMIQSDILLSKVSVKGEISNFVHHKSGHMYFDLKDNASKIRVVFFKWDNIKIEESIKDGDQVILDGYIDFYDKEGSIQYYAKNAQLDGTGDIYKQFQELKEKLEKEGLFDQTFKKTLPLLPKKVGVITADTGAAIHDIINVSKRRYPGAKIILFPSLVQGKDAPKQLIYNLNILDNRSDIDVIIIGRGGGSFEDLNAFNDEELARTIFSCKKPIVSAVGHEVDFSISDFVADLRAPTPSAAAELVFPNTNELLLSLGHLKSRLTTLLIQKLDQKLQKLAFINEKLDRYNPVQKTSLLEINISNLKIRLMKQIIHKAESNTLRLKLLQEKIKNLNPLDPLDKGYGLVLDKNRKPLLKLSEVKKSKVTYLKMSDGESQIVLKE